MGSAASTAYKLGQETSGSSGIGAGLGGVAGAMRGAATDRMRGAFGIREAAARGERAAWAAGSNASAPAGGVGSTDATPAWARKLHDSQNARHRRQMAIHAIRDGDHGGGSATPDLKEKD
jgi:type IV secretion system protein TrbL